MSPTTAATAPAMTLSGWRRRRSPSVGGISAEIASVLTTATPPARNAVIEPVVEMP